ncbi:MULTISPECIES: hypothetical protein [Bradyrhizobium]|uniref:hypothetical protein n=1 Tax=Bradyrhizobium elkanii TaxID=29448 RepID=UPI000414FFD2
MELVAGAGETAKAHPFEGMLDRQVCKPHLHLFARIARILIDVASDLLELSARASMLERASAAL